MTTQERSKALNDILIKAGIKGIDVTMTRSTTIIKCQCLDTANAAANYLKSAGWIHVSVKERMEYRSTTGKYVNFWNVYAFNPGIEID